MREVRALESGSSLEVKRDFMLYWIRCRSPFGAMPTLSSRSVKMRFGIVARTGEPEPWWSDSPRIDFVLCPMRSRAFSPEAGSDVLDRTDFLFDLINHRRQEAYTQALSNVQHDDRARGRLRDRSIKAACDAVMGSADRHPEVICLITDGDIPEEVRAGVALLADDAEASVSVIARSLTERMDLDAATRNSLEDISDQDIILCIQAAQPAGAIAENRPSPQRVRDEAADYLRAAAARREVVTDLDNLVRAVATTLWFGANESPTRARMNELFVTVFNYERQVARLRRMNYPADVAEELVLTAQAEAWKRVNHLIIRAEYGQLPELEEDDLIRMFAVRIKKCLKEAQSAEAEERDASRRDPQFGLGDPRSIPLANVTSNDLLASVSRDPRLLQLPRELASIALEWARWPFSADGSVGLSVLEIQLQDALGELATGRDEPEVTKILETSLAIGRDALGRMVHHAGSVGETRGDPDDER